jgi:hypothetical protein
MQAYDSLLLSGSYFWYGVSLGKSRRDFECLLGYITTFMIIMIRSAASQLSFRLQLQHFGYLEEKDGLFLEDAIIPHTIASLAISKIHKAFLPTHRSQKWHMVILAALGINYSDLLG